MAILPEEIEPLITNLHIEKHRTKIWELFDILNAWKSPGYSDVLRYHSRMDDPELEEFGKTVLNLYEKKKIINDYIISGQVFLYMEEGYK